MWEARAEYSDGTTFEGYYDDDGRPEEKQQYDLESMLIERKEGCIWYSVGWINTD